jgi:hypothetical protein
MLKRQGDVLFKKFETKPEDLDPAPKDARGLVLAEGETSGHFHAVFGRGSKLFNFRDGGLSARVLVVGKAGAEVRVVGGGSGGVPRHHPVSLSSGTWEVRTQRQWTAEDEQRSRAVAD